MSLSPVADSHVATVVTTLEMRQPPPLRPAPSSPLWLKRWRSPEPERYRALFRRVGEHWLWFSRLVMSDDALLGIIADAQVEVYAAIDSRGVEVGMLELDLRRAGEAEISYFALVPELAGQGLGRWLMAQALTLAWRPGISRVWLHTCTLDHPSALNFYRAQGFQAVARTIETFADPRATGLLPTDAAPQIPYLAKAR
jgi:GNAT superfamily N-acetyltransferase